MSLPFAVPDWMPGWLMLALAIPVLLWCLAFLMVPFSVFGVKARLEALENEIQELNEQMRVMQLRAAGAGPVTSPARAQATYDELPNFAQIKRARMDPEPLPVQEPPPAKYPPIPTPQPRSAFSSRDAMVPRERPVAPPRPRRTEPRLD